MLLQVLLSSVLTSCVVDRTGQSSTGTMRKQLSEHEQRVAELETVGTDVGRRVGQLEEVTRAKGQDEILKMETMEQLRQETARMRGDFEVLQRESKTVSDASVGFQTDLDWRVRYLEQRIANLEKQLRITPPPPPPRSGEAPTVTDPGTSGATTPATTTPVATADPVPSTPEETFALIAKHLSEGRGAAARAVAEGFIRDNPKSERVAEARYRIAESYQNESDFTRAASAFQSVIDKHPDSPWTPWSMLRQGECFAAMGKKSEARIFWVVVVRLYPKSKAAKEAKTNLAQK